MAALISEAPPAPLALELMPAPGDDTSTASWTAAEIETVAGLLNEANADPEHWRLGDYLCARVPVGAVRGRKIGTGRRLAELARLVGVSHNHLRSIRDTAHHWPPETRVPAAPFHVHGAFRDGGRERAGWRREQLLTMDRHAGKITAKSLRYWREAQGGEHAPGIRSGHRGRRLTDSELVQRIDELLGDVDQRLRQGGSEKLLAPLRADLDALAGDLERLELALAA